MTWTTVHELGDLPSNVPVAVNGFTLECFMHGSRFDVRTGAALNLPATRPVTTYPVRVVDGQVQVFRA